MALALSTLGLLLVEEEKKKRPRKIRRKHTKWVKPWILQRQAQGAFPNLCRELELDETSDLKNFALLFPIQFHRLKELISPIVQRRNTNYRDCISVGERLMITLRFLATGKQAKGYSLFKYYITTPFQLCLFRCIIKHYKSEMNLIISDGSCSLLKKRQHIKHNCGCL